MIDSEYLNLLDQLPNGIVIVKQDFTILFWNRCLEEWTDIRKRDIEGKNLFEAIPSLNKPAITARFPQVFEQGTPAYFASKFHPCLIPSPLPDGTCRVQKGSVLPIRLAHEVLAMLVLEDVTDLVQQVVSYRKMRDLAQQELDERKRAEDELRVVNAKLTLFSDITLQDIRNQLTAARGFNHLVCTTLTDPDRIRSIATKVDGQLSIIERYVSLMMDFEQIATQPSRWYSLETVISQARGLAQFFDTDIGTGVGGLELFCPPLLDRIIANLLENARQHGKRTTTVRISFIPREGDSGLLIFEDDGEGIPPERKEFIFSKGLGSKTNLGLYHSREILGITGISMREAGQSGKGARFELVVPKEGYRYQQDPQPPEDRKA